MVNIKFENFFDKPGVIKQIDDGTRRALSRIGAYVRTDARSSIRRRKGVASPGSPPSSHTGLLRQFIQFAYDPDTKSVVIGPALLNGAKRKGNPTPELLEFGGTTPHWKTGKPAVYRAFPFMAPALKRTQTKFPSFFENLFTSV